MTEKYLHYLWDKKLIPFHKLKKLNSLNFKILHFGTYNQFESGPDFFDAGIQINQLKWFGNVEMHLRSSDWYRHNHHKDSAYNTVILHVVFEHDKEIKQNGFEIPTIELKSVIDWNHCFKFHLTTKKISKILCGSQFNGIEGIHKIHFLEKALYMRLNRKTKRINDLYDSSYSAHFYFFILKSFGTKTNQLPFEELANRIDFIELKKMNIVQQSLIIRSISNLFNQQNNKLDQMTPSSWKYGGVRPSNFPDRRINQFIQFFNAYNFNLEFINASAIDIIHFFKNKAMNFTLDNSITFSDSFKNLLLINGIVPFMFWYGTISESQEIIDKAIDILYLLPPENNHIIKKWKDFNILPKNAAESQAYLEIFNEFCTNKKCLNCSIGQQLLAV